MTHLKVYRSAGREMLLLCAGLLLVLAAFDVIWFHQIAGPPEVDETTGALTSTGRSQRRTDLIWGSMFVVAGGGMALVAAGGLVVRRPVVEVTENGLELRIAGPQRSMTVPWSNVSWVHSGTDGEDEAVPPRVFLVHVFDRSAYSDQLWGADWDGATLMVDADSWSVRDVEVVAHSQMALDAWRRRSNEAAPVDEEQA
jgi:hypothetical protein